MSDQHHRYNQDGREPAKRTTASEPDRHDLYALMFWAIERVVWVIFCRSREAPVTVTLRTSTEQQTK